jgi:uncharacterized phage-like protein YoqJ
MKLSRILFLLAWLIVYPGMFGCDAQKEMSQRRNYMMPHTDELPRNYDKYKPPKKKKTYKKKHKKRKTKRFAHLIITGKVERLRA